MNLSERIKKVAPSSTLAISQKAKEMKKSGIDVVSFGAGEPDFDTPEFIRDAAKAALDEGYTRYTPVAGLPELKTAIADSIHRNTGVKYLPEQILTTCGAKAGLFMAFQVIANPGDEVLVPVPYWVSYPEQIKLADAVPVYIKTTEKNKFKITAEDIEKSAGNKTKLLIINSPNNPTGSVYTKDELRNIIKVCRSKGIVVIADEIYDKLVFEGNFCSVLSASPEDVDNIIYINGVSKSYAMTGWRMGYVAGPKDVIQAMTKYQGQLYSNITSFVQKAAITALSSSDDIIENMRRVFHKRRDLMMQLIGQIPNVSCVKPDGAFYAFVNVGSYIGKSSGGVKINSSDDLANYLLEDAHVAAVPGTAFGADEYIRLSFALSNSDIEKGVLRIKEALLKLY